MRTTNECHQADLSVTEYDASDGPIRCLREPKSRHPRVCPLSCRASVGPAKPDGDQGGGTPLFLRECRTSGQKSHANLGFLLEQTVAHLRVGATRRFLLACPHGGGNRSVRATGESSSRFRVQGNVSPKGTASMRSAVEVLDLHELNVGHGSDAAFPLKSKIRAVAASRLVQEI